MILTDVLERLRAINQTGAFGQVLLRLGQRITCEVNEIVSEYCLKTTTEQNSVSMRLSSLTFLVPTLTELRVVVTLESLVSSVLIAIGHHDCESQTQIPRLFLHLLESSGPLS